MPMPSRQIVGGELYRYAFQGQEKDTETDKEAFQLRLWDGRIGRWLTTDPYGQFSSPYIGMGNNPINFIDPDGGACYDAQGNQIPCPDGYNNFDIPYLKDIKFGGELVSNMTNALDEVFIGNKTGNILPFGSESTFVGDGLSFASDFTFNKYFWRGKNGNFYNHNFNGNQYTGGKLKYAERLSKNLGRASAVLNVYSIASTESAYGAGQISQQRRNTDQVVNGIGFLGAPGAAFNVGFNLGYLIEDTCNCNIQINWNNVNVYNMKHGNFNKFFKDSNPTYNTVFSSEFLQTKN